MAPAFARRLLPLLGSLAVAAPLPAAAQSPKAGVWWESTVTMDLAGMGMAMPPTTTRMCLPKADPSGPPELPMQGDDCRMEDVKRSKNKTSWKIRCASEQTTGEGEVVRGADSYEGSLTMRSEDGVMPMKFKGRKVGGDCDPEAIQRKSDARVEETRRTMEANRVEAEARMRADQAARCDQAVQAMEPAALKYECKEPRYKARLCERLGTVEGYLTTNEGTLREAGALCGKDLATLRSTICASGEKQLKANPPPIATLRFVVRHCPAQTKAVAKRECAGRDITGMEGPYADFCASYAENLEDDAEGTTVPASAPQKSRRAPQEDAIKQGADALKGVFGF